MFSVGLFVLRVVVGLTVAGHGSQKLFGWFGGPGISGFRGWLTQMNVKPAGPWALGAALAEFAGGLLVAVGFLTPIAALAVCGSMLSAIFLVHWAKGFWNMHGGYEFPLVILTAMVGLALTGPGAISLDSVAKVALAEPITLLVTGALVVLGVAAALISTRLQPIREAKPQVG